MLRLDIKNRFGPKSHIYFDNCSQHYDNFLNCNSKIRAKFDELALGKCTAIEAISLINETEGYWASAVVFGAMCLEAFIYDYAAAHFSDTYVRNYLDGIDFVAKWVVVPKLVTGKYFPTDSQAFELLKKLCKERNELVHAKSKPAPADSNTILVMAQEYQQKTNETRKTLNPYDAIVEVLTELRKLEDDELRAQNWELTDAGI